MCYFNYKSYFFIMKNKLLHWFNKFRSKKCKRDDINNNVNDDLDYVLIEE